VSERRDRFDPELDELFGDDPDLLRLAQQVRESRPEPDLDPRFPPVLRAHLMQEAQRALAPRPGFRLAPGRLAAWGSLALGVALVAAAIAVVVSHAPSGRLAVVASNVSHRRTVDPHQAITLSFNQPMDEQSVAAVLKITPATQVSVTWENPETLVLTPLHPLAADTDYQVTIPEDAVRSQSGQTLASTVTIDFGTQPATPGPTVAPVPALQATAVAWAASGAQAFWGPGAAPGATDSTAVEPTPSASPSATAPASTEVSSESSATSSTPTPAPAEGAVIFPPGQPAMALSEMPAAAVKVSPNGFNVALAVVQPGGDAEIVVENADGSQPNQVWPTGSTSGAPVTALAWDGDNRIVFVTPRGIYAVDLDDQWSELFAFPSGGSASGVVLAPDGVHAFIPAVDMPSSAATATASPSATGSSTSPSASASGTGASAAASPAATYLPTAADGWLLTLPAAGGQVATPTQLPGSASGVVAFSGSGDEVAWAATSGKASTLLEAPTAAATTVTAVPGAPVEGIQELALDAHGTTIAYGFDPGGIEVATAGGSVLGTSPREPSSLAFSPDGTQLAFVAAGSLDVARVQAASPSVPTSACADGDQVLSRFVDAQVSHDLSALAALSAAGAPPAATVTPASVHRGYVVSSSCAAGTATAGPTLTASARLIVDPAGTSPGQLSDETVVLGQSDGRWLVTGLSVPPLSAQGSAPHVLSVGVTPPAAGSINPESVVTVTFDSDLDASSVSAASLWLETAGGQTLSPLGPPTYDPDTRQAALTVAGTLPAGTEVVVGTAMSDIDGGHPPATSVYPVGG
jgi:hypothetical protein